MYIMYNLNISADAKRGLDQDQVARIGVDVLEAEKDIGSERNHAVKVGKEKGALTKEETGLANDTDQKVAPLVVTHPVAAEIIALAIKRRVKMVTVNVDLAAKVPKREEKREFETERETENEGQEAMEGQVRYIQGQEVKVQRKSQERQRAGKSLISLSDCQPETWRIQIQALTSSLRGVCYVFGKHSHTFAYKGSRKLLGDN